jgi:mono/diheme cytochrome c family protein
MGTKKLLNIAICPVVCAFVVAVGLGVVSTAHAANAAAGKKTYMQLCASCHGTSGKGDGAAAAAMNPKPKDLSVAKSKGDAYLKKVITKGGPAVGLSPMMAPMGASLKPAELDDLIAFLKSL